MTWFKVDDSFYDHPKMFDAPDCAVALWTRAGSWAARNLTDGFVPSKMPARLCDDHETAVRELVQRGMWQRTSRGYVFHDWATYNPTAEQVKDRRAKTAERVAKHRARNVVTNALVPEYDSVTNSVTNDVSNPAPVPSRPVVSSSLVSHSPYVPRASQNDDDRLDLDKIQNTLACDQEWARRVANEVLTRGSGHIGNPTRYVLAAISQEPDRYRPTKGPPALRDLCRHGLPATRCDECGTGAQSASPRASA